MKTIESVGYKVYFDDKLSALSRFVQEQQYSKVLILVDRNTAEYCLPIVQANVPGLDDYDIIEIDPGEENKNIDFCIGIWKMMLDFGADRNSLLINLGGGVVTDIGGFAAATFKRGFDFVQVPTTLLAQVDASVGGKTGIDLDGVKNIIGTFTQPKAVFISNLFLETLDERQQLSGMAEVIKHGLIRDAEFYRTISTLPAGGILPEHIRHSIAIKNEVVMADPLESGLRKILNFGHTIGHAIETQSLLSSNGDPLLHGEAIAAGMICEAYLSTRIAGLSQTALDEISNQISERYGWVPMPASDDSALLGIMANDKKNEQERIGFALLSAIGQCQPGYFAEPSLIRESLDFYRRRSEGQRPG